MTVTYHRLLLHPGLLAPIRRALLLRDPILALSARLEVWESEGGALERRLRKIREMI